MAKHFCQKKGFTKLFVKCFYFGKSYFTKVIFEYNKRISKDTDYLFRIKMLVCKIQNRFTITITICVMHLRTVHYSINNVCGVWYRADGSGTGLTAGDDTVVGGPKTPQQIAAQKRLQQSQAQVDEVRSVLCKPLKRTHYYFFLFFRWWTLWKRTWWKCWTGIKNCPNWTTEQVFKSFS